MAWPVAMFIKDNLAKVLSASQDRNELPGGKQAPFYHASFKRLSNSAVATSLDFEHGWQILQFPVYRIYQRPSHLQT